MEKVIFCVRLCDFITATVSTSTFFFLSLVLICISLTAPPFNGFVQICNLS